MPLPALYDYAVCDDALQNMDEEDLGRTLREIKILRHLRGHPHIIHLQQVLQPLQLLQLCSSLMCSNCGPRLEMKAPMCVQTFAPFNTDQMDELYLVLKSFEDEVSAHELPS